MRGIRTFLFGFLVFALSKSVLTDGADQYPSLGESHDPGLQQQPEASLTELGLHQAIQCKKLNVALVDISDPDLTKQQ